MAVERERERHVAIDYWDSHSDTILGVAARVFGSLEPVHHFME